MFVSLGTPVPAGVDSSVATTAIRLSSFKSVNFSRSFCLWPLTQWIGTGDGESSMGETLDRQNAETGTIVVRNRIQHRDGDGRRLE